MSKYEREQRKREHNRGTGKGTNKIRTKSRKSRKIIEVAKPVMRKKEKERK